MLSYIVPSGLILRRDFFSTSDLEIAIFLQFIYDYGFNLIKIIFCLKISLKIIYLP
jgi:hypothetical protein